MRKRDNSLEPQECLDQASATIERRRVDIGWVRRWETGRFTDGHWFEEVGEMCEEDRPRLLLAVPAVEDAAKLARLKAETFVETFGDSNDPIALDAHVADTFNEKVAAGLADPNCSTLWVLDAGEPVGYMKMNLAPAQSEPALAAGLEVEQIYSDGAIKGVGSAAC